MKFIYNNPHLHPFPTCMQQCTQPDSPVILVGINQDQLLKSTLITPGKQTK